MHQIRKHIVSIDCSSSPFGKEVQLALPDLMEREFYPRLEKLLDQYPMADATWVIDSVPITIPPVSKKNWKSELVNKALQEIEAFLNENYSAVTTHGSATAGSSSLLLTGTQQAEFLFIEYLKTGFFNRNAQYATVSDIEKQLAASTFKMPEARMAFFREMVAVFLEYPKSLLRFIFTVSEETRSTVRKDRIGFLFDLETILKNQKPAKKIISTARQYNNWIQLLDWSLYFFKTDNPKVAVRRFKEFSFSDFQLDAAKINEFLDFLVHSSKGKLTAAQQDALQLFLDEVKEQTSSKTDFTVHAYKNQDLKNDEGHAATEEGTITDTTRKKSAEKDNLKAHIKIEEPIHTDADKNTESEHDQDVTGEVAAGKEKLADLSETKGESSKKSSTKETKNDSKSKNPELQPDKHKNSGGAIEQPEEERYSKISKNPDSSDTEFQSQNFEKEAQKVPESANNSYAADLSVENENKDGNQIGKKDSKTGYRRFDLDDANNADADNTIDTASFSDNKKAIFENPFYIENSGLVILHPFLIHLFEQLKLCKNEEWTSKRNQCKAVLITQYLITGSTVFFENDLVLNKIICGLEADAVIDVAIKLSAKEIREAKGLLEAVIGYWKALKNSSIDGLRETFLQRNGKLLIKEETNAELWVEQKGFDVLMAQIPWGIGMVKTPWMKSFLECNWN